MLAHVGHWAISLLYVLPVVLVVGFISIRAILDRRNPPPAAPPDPDDD